MWNLALRANKKQILVNEVMQYAILLIRVLAHFNIGTPRMGGALPVLNPMAVFFIPHTQAATIAGPTASASDTPTVRPASQRPSTPPSLERFARELRELKSTGLSNKQRLTVMHDQRRQLLSHMTTAKAEIDQLEGRLQREESIEGSQDILNRLKELNGLRGWVGYKCAYISELSFPTLFQNLSRKTKHGSKYPPFTFGPVSQ